MPKGLLCTLTVCYWVIGVISITGAVLLETYGYHVKRNWVYATLLVISPSIGTFLVLVHPKRIWALLTLIVAGHSVMAVFDFFGTVTFREQDNVTGKFQETYLLFGNGVINDTWTDSTGRMYFPFMPWTPLILISTSTSLWFLALGLVTALTSFDLLVSTIVDTDLKLLLLEWVSFHGFSFLISLASRSWKKVNKKNNNKKSLNQG